MRSKEIFSDFFLSDCHKVINNIKFPLRANKILRDKIFWTLCICMYMRKCIHLPHKTGGIWQWTALCRNAFLGVYFVQIRVMRATFGVILNEILHWAWRAAASDIRRSVLANYVFGNQVASGITEFQFNWWPRRGCYKMSWILEIGYTGLLCKI